MKELYLATLFPNYEAMDFDLEIAMESPKIVVTDPEEAVRWAEKEVHEGRDASTVWEKHEYRNLGGGSLHVVWGTECNEYGTAEEWFLFIEPIQLVE